MNSFFNPFPTKVKQSVVQSSSEIFVPPEKQFKIETITTKIQNNKIIKEISQSTIQDYYGKLSQKQQEQIKLQQEEQIKKSTEQQVKSQMSFIKSGVLGKIKNQGLEKQNTKNKKHFLIKKYPTKASSKSDYENFQNIECDTENETKMEQQSYSEVYLKGKSQQNSLSSSGIFSNRSLTNHFQKSPSNFAFQEQKLSERQSHSQPGSLFSLFETKLGQKADEIIKSCKKLQKRTKSALIKTECRQLKSRQQ